MMSEHERQLILKIAGNEQKNLFLIFQLQKTIKKFIPILQYCASKNITGKTFYNLCAEHNFSPVRVGSHLLKKSEQHFRQFSINDLT